MSVREAVDALFPAEPRPRPPYRMSYSELVEEVTRSRAELLQLQDLKHENAALQQRTAAAESACGHLRRQNRAARISAAQARATTSVYRDRWERAEARLVAALSNGELGVRALYEELRAVERGRQAAVQLLQMVVDFYGVEARVFVAVHGSSLSTRELCDRIRAQFPEVRRG